MSDDMNDHDELIRMLTDANVELQESYATLLRRVRSEAFLDVVDSLSDEGLVRPDILLIAERLRNVIRDLVPASSYRDLCLNLGLPLSGPLNPPRSER